MTARSSAGRGERMRRDGRTQAMGRNGALAALISGMTPRERRALHEAVKRRILREEDKQASFDTAIQSDKGAKTERLEVKITDGEGRNILVFFYDGSRSPNVLSVRFVEVKGKELTDANNSAPTIVFKEDGNVEKTYQLFKNHIDLFNRTFGVKDFKGIGRFIERYDNEKTVRAFVSKFAPFALDKIFPAEGDSAPAPASAPSAPAPAPAPASAPSAPAPAPSEERGADDPNIWSAFAEESIGLLNIGASDGAAASDSDPSATAGDANTDGTASKVYEPGATFTSGGKEIFKRTQAGWVAVMRLTADQVASLVKPNSRDFVLDDLRELSRGEEYKIRKGILVKPEIAREKDFIVFEREGDLFRDPTVLTDTEMDEVASSFGTDLTPSADGSITSAQQSGNYAIGDAVIRIENSKTTITVEDDGSGTYRGFDDLFGADSNVAEKLQSAVEKYKEKNGQGTTITKITFSLKDAMDKSLMRKFAPLLGSNITFISSGDGEFKSELKIGRTDAQKELRRMVADGRAKAL